MRGTGSRHLGPSATPTKSPVCLGVILKPFAPKCSTLPLAMRDLVQRSFAQLGRVDVVVGNAGYGLFGAAEELSDKQIGDMIATDLVR